MFLPSWAKNHATRTRLWYGFTRLFAKFLPLLFNTCTSLITGTFADSNITLIWLLAEIFIQTDISLVNVIKMCNVLIKIQKHTICFIFLVTCSLRPITRSPDYLKLFPFPYKFDLSGVKYISCAYRISSFQAYFKLTRILSHLCK